MEKENLIDIFISNKNKDDRGITVILSEDKEEFIPYSKIYRNACKYLNVFKNNRIDNGNELLFQIEDIEKFLSIFWACQLGGITAVPIDIGENDENNTKIFRIWSVLNNPYYLTNKDNLGRLVEYSNNDNKEIIKELSERYISDDIPEEDSENIKIFDYKNKDYIALIQFSSGSTGVPKGIPIKYTSLYKHVNALAKREEVTEKDVTLNWAPLSHNLGLVSVHLVSTLKGINQYIMSKKLFVKNPMIWMDKASEHKATMLYSPNFGFRYFLKCEPNSVHKEWDLSSVRVVFNGAEPINYELCNQFVSAMRKYNLSNNTIYPAYGCSESTSVISIPDVGSPLKAYKVNREKIDIGQKVELIEESCKSNYINLVSCGYVVDNCEIRVCDDNNNILNDFYVGNLQVRGINVIDSYYNNEEATKKAFYEDGWFNTGDLCFMDKGNVVITGRFKEIIFINGQNYYPYDIERVAEEVEETLIGNIAACGLFDEELQTDKICMFIEYNKNNDKFDFDSIVEKIKVHVSKKMGIYISEIIPVNRLEKTDSGKLQRLKLGKNYLEGKYDDYIKEVSLKCKDIECNENNSIEDNVLAIWRKVLADKDLTLDDNFFEVGGSSNLLIVLNNEIEKIYKGKVSGIDIFEAPTSREFSKLIETRSLKDNANYIYGNKLQKVFLQELYDNEYYYSIIKKPIDKFDKIVNYQDINELIMAIYTQFIGQVIQEDYVKFSVLNKNQDSIKNISLSSFKDIEIEDIVKEINKQLNQNTEVCLKDVQVRDTEEVETVFSYGENVDNKFNADVIIWVDSGVVNFKINTVKIKLEVFERFLSKFDLVLKMINEEFVFD
ncbi:MAG: hypothetical protein E7214_09425 [Clostridium sp.]|nr:hypothetical protein [Clostridium sp.]